MFTCARITDVEYYLDEAKKAADQKEEDGSESKRDRAAYYLDNGAGEDKGIWWSPKKGQPDALVTGGGEVDPKAFRAMARGCDPKTGEPLVQTNRKERLAGYDLQFAAPKSVSVLWAMATPEQRQVIEQAQRVAVHRALDFAQEEGLIVTRRGSAKNGLEAVPVADAAVAEFLHTTSRAGDPQVHSHAVLLNVCMRHDGTSGTLDNARILQYQGAMGAVYRAELAASLQRELGLAISKDERNFKVVGVPASVAELFSKRRAAIETEAELNGYTTASDRDRARLAAVATRDKKSSLPDREDLEERWKREVRAEGWTPEAIWQSAQAARLAKDEARDSDADPLTPEQAQEREQALRHVQAAAALRTLEQTEAVLERRHIMREVIERQQGLTDADGALAEVLHLVETGQLIELPPREDGEDICYATPAMIERERAMLAGVLRRQGEREFVAPDRIEAAIRSRSSMSAEQAEAVRHALNHDGVVVVEGSAGTGKSFSLGSVADAARDAGMHVWVVAPSHKAKDVIRADTITDEDSAKAVQGFINRLDPAHKDPITLSADDCIIIDEAGMVGTPEMSKLLAYANDAGAKVVLAGDTRQLQPVTAGGPMGAIKNLCGSQRISEIRRQKEEWQRAASSSFASGDTDTAFDAYYDRGHVHLEETEKGALQKLADDWRSDVERNPEAAMSKPHEARLVVAGRNKDVRALNAVLRDAYRDAGRLQGEDVELQAFSRGTNGKLEGISIAVGERLIFGESVTINGVSINNSDFGTVQAIKPGADPLVKIRLDKGETVEAPWSAFVGRRAEDAEPADLHPKVQHAYAVTIHASQGTTVNRCFVYNGHGMGMESAYVGMTRHREQADLYVDASRIIDRLEAKKRGNPLKMSWSGKVDTKDADEEDAAREESTISQAEIANVLKHELSRSEQKRNISDFLREKKEWALGEKTLDEAAYPKLKDSFPVPPKTEPWMMQDGGWDNLSDELKGSASQSYKLWAEEKPQYAALYGLESYVSYTQEKWREDQERSLAALEAIVSEGAMTPRRRKQESKETDIMTEEFNEPKMTPSAPEAVEPDLAQAPKAAEEMRAHMAARAQGPRYPVRRFETDPNELDRFCREIDLARYIQDRGGYSVNQKKSNPKQESWCLERPGDTIFASRKNGVWVWWRAGSGAGHDATNSGSIISYVQNEENPGEFRGKLGKVRIHLRKELGEGSTLTKSEVVRHELRYAPPKQDAFDFSEIRRRWHSLKEGVSEWLEARGLTRATLERFRTDIRLDTAPNARGVCFAHRDEHGDITGWTRKGPKRHPLDERSISMSAADAPRRMTRMGDREDPRLIYIAEKAIDALSIYQMDKSPTRALLVTTEGTPSAKGIEELEKLAARYPNARFGLHFDNDQDRPELVVTGNPRAADAIFDLRIKEAAGKVFAKMAEVAIRRGAPEAVIVHRYPPSQFKDWNDALRGITIEKAEADYQAALARCGRIDASADDQVRALERRARDLEAQELALLWSAKQAGKLTPEALNAAGRAIYAAREERKEAVETLANAKPEQLRQTAAEMQIQLAQRAYQAAERGGAGPQELAEKRRELQRLEAEAAARKRQEDQRQARAQEIAQGLRPGYAPPRP